MTDAEKEKLLKKMKNRESGDVSPCDNDLVKSESYMKKNQAIRSEYKDFYDDVKFTPKEDW